MQIIGVIVAENQDLARKAAALVRRPEAFLAARFKHMI
jgi:hypothetical protein